MRNSIQTKTEQITETIRRTLDGLGAQRGFLMIVDDKTGCLKVRVSCSMDPAHNIPRHTISSIPICKRLAGVVAKTQKPILINNIDEVFKKYPTIVKKTDLKKHQSSILIPIIEKGRTVAVLNINDKKQGKHWTKKDLNTAQTLAHYCGMALQWEKKNKELLHITEIAREISSTDDMEAIYKLVVKKGAELLHCKDVSLMLAEEIDKHYALIVKESINPKVIGQIRKPGEGVSGYVWKTGKPVLVKSIEKASASKRFEILNKPGSFIVVPLNIRYKTSYALNISLKSRPTIGVLNFTNKYDGSEFTENDLEGIITYVNLVLIAIEKTHFYTEAKSGYLGTIKTLCSIIEARDKYVKGHSDSVVTYSIEMAARLKLSKEKVADLQFAGLLHDIGKVAIPDAILNKPFPLKLTDEEYACVKKHVIESERILKDIPFLSNVRKIIRHHHEWFNGQGYPTGVKGTKILIEARILSIADAYDAMISGRVYKPAISKESAIEELKGCKGTQFDAEITDVFIETLNNEYRRVK